jgi:hypothetical protein
MILNALSSIVSGFVKVSEREIWNIALVRPCFIGPREPVHKERAIRLRFAERRRH